MQFINNNLKKNNIIILFFSLLIVSVKWIYSFYLYDEDIFLRIIQDTGDNAYYPLIKSFSDLNLNPGYSEKYSNLSFVSFPFLSLITNSFFLKFFNGYSFILLELICIFLFFKIFLHIFFELGVDSNRALLFILITFSLIKILHTMALFNINIIEIIKLNFASFYSLRFPRPIITNLFLYAFIYYLIKFYKSETNDFNYLIILSILMGLSLNSFFYHAVNEFFFLLIVFFFKFKFNFIRIALINYKKIIISIIIGLIFLSIFIYQINFSEVDFSERLGIFDVDTNQKIILMEYFKDFVLKKEFIILFVINTLIFIYLNNSVLKIFYIIFIGSLISSAFVFLTFNQGVDYYHFINLIVIFSLLHFIFFLFFIFDQICRFIFNQKKYLYFNNILIILILSFIILFDLNNYNNSQNNKVVRLNKNELINYIKKNNLFENKKLEIFTFNKDISIWLILNDFRNFSILPVSLWTSKTNNNLEKELYSTANFFNLDLQQFNELIKNELKSWRYKNDFIYNFFGRKYLANNFTHYDDDFLDYSNNEAEFIKKNNMLIAHQVIIPKSEINRLESNFLMSNNKITPDIVIVDTKEFKIFSNIPSSYCLIFENETFKIYISNNLKDYCN